MVAIISANDYSRLINEREERFKILNKIKKKTPSLPLEEVQSDIVSALKAVRKK